MYSFKTMIFLGIFLLYFCWTLFYAHKLRLWIWRRQRLWTRTWTHGPPSSRWWQPGLVGDWHIVFLHRCLGLVVIMSKVGLKKEKHEIVGCFICSDFIVFQHRGMWKSLYPLFALMKPKSSSQFLTKYLSLLYMYILIFFPLLSFSEILIYFFLPLLPY